MSLSPQQILIAKISFDECAHVWLFFLCISVLLCKGLANSVTQLSLNEWR